MLPQDMRDRFVEMTPEEMNQYISFPNDHQIIYFGLKKYNRKNFTKLSDDFKNYCQKLPQDKRDRFVELTPEEIDKYIALPENFNSLFYSCNKQEGKEFLAMTL